MRVSLVHVRRVSPVPAIFLVAGELFLFAGECPPLADEGQFWLVWRCILHDFNCLCSVALSPAALLVPALNSSSMCVLIIDMLGRSAWAAVELSWRKLRYVAAVDRLGDLSGVLPRGHFATR